MKTLIVIALLVAATLAAVTLITRRRKPEASLPYKKHTPLTAPEQALFHRLTAALPDNIVLAQVSFAAFLRTTAQDSQTSRSAWARAKQKRADYLVCSKAFEPLAVIELDDNSHDKEKDARRDAICSAAEIPVIRWNVKALPSTTDIKAALKGETSGDNPKVLRAGSEKSGQRLRPSSPARNIAPSNKQVPARTENT